MKREAYTAANIEAWDEAAPLHREQNMSQLLADFADPDFLCLEDIEIQILREIDVSGKDVAQICCNNGRELLSIKRLGARRCVGFDGAQEFIDQAVELSQASGSDCEFVCTDIYSLPAEFDGAFDVAVITIGVLSWMPDLRKFFKTVARLLRPKGVIFIHEQHPILDMFAPGSAKDPLEWEWHYFSDEAYIETTGLDYYGGGTYKSKPLYSFTHKLSDIIMAGLDNGLHLEHFEERPDHISNFWYNVEAHEYKLPMSFSMTFRNFKYE